MKICEIISKLRQIDTVCGDKNMSLLATAEIMNDNKIGALPVVDQQYKLEGVVSERDIVRFIAERPKEFFGSIVEDAMTTNVITCRPEDSAGAIYDVLIKNKIRHIPVIENGELSVMLSMRDFDGLLANRRSQTDESGMPMPEVVN